jgi:hypothetical protein
MRSDPRNTSNTSKNTWNNIDDAHTKAHE